MSRGSRVRELAGVTLLAVGLAIYFTYPLAARPGSLGRVDSGDGQFSVWNVAWVSHALLTPNKSVFDANIFYPHRGTLAYSEPNLGAGLLGVPGYALTGNPHVAHNTAVLIGLTLSVMGMYFLVRQLGGSRQGAIVSAVVFSFCPFVFARTAHIQLLMFWPLPCVLLIFHAWVDRPRVGMACLLGVGLAVQALFCSYFGVLAGLIVGFGTVFYAIARGCWRQPRWWGQALLAAVVSVAIVLPFFVPYLELQRETGFKRALDEARVYSADWRAYLASSAWAHEWMLAYIVTWKEVLFPGFTAIVLGAVGIAAGLRRHQQPGVVEAGCLSRETTVFYVLLGLLALWSSFGPAAGLYSVLYHTVPVFSLLRAPARFGLAVSLALAVLTATGVGAVLGSVTPKQRRGWIASAILVFVIAELSMTMPYRTVAASPRVYDELAVSRPGAVAEFPFHHESHQFSRHSAYMLASTKHWLPLINGYSDYIPPEVAQAAPLLASFPNPEGFAFLRERRARYAVFHLGLYDSVNRAAVISRINAYREYLRPMNRDGDVWLFEIVGWPDVHPARFD